MAKRGRTIQGPKAVQGMEGSEHAKQRLQVILETVTGSLSIKEACDRLNIGRSAFYELRRKALQHALEGLEPGPPGRPRIAADTENERIAELEQELTDLRIDLEASRIREELAIAMPHVLDNRHKQTKKKNPQKKKAVKQQRKKQRKQNKRKR